MMMDGLPWWGWLVLGLWLGLSIGIFLMVLRYAAKEARERDRFLRGPWGSPPRGRRTRRWFS